MSGEADLDLRELDDEELTKQIQDDLYDGLKDEVVEGVEILLERGWEPYDVLTEALVAAWPSSASISATVSSSCPRCCSPPTR
jgi:methanogenic corrinoid protein MtbC1